MDIDAFQRSWGGLKVTMHGCVLVFCFEWEPSEGLLFFTFLTVFQ